jgi:hypothetical protein
VKLGFEAGDQEIANRLHDFQFRGEEAVETSLKSIMLQVWIRHEVSWFLCGARSKCWQPNNRRPPDNVKPLLPPRQSPEMGPERAVPRAAKLQISRGFFRCFHASGIGFACRRTVQHLMSVLNLKRD